MRKVFIITGIIFCFSFKGLTQSLQDAALPNATLSDCIQYALKHQPAIQQSLIDEKIVRETIRTRLADWLPQLNLDASYQHNFQLPTNFFGGNFVSSGSHHISAVDFAATQNIFDRDVLLALRSSGDVKQAARQITDSTTIGMVAGVSKAFYDILLTQKQLSVLDEDIVRLNRSLEDAYNQYKGGIVDKTDYKRATISLNNAKAQRKQQQDLLTSKYFYLRQLMGYPDSAYLQLQYDSLELERETSLDTLQEINYGARIEYRLLQTEKNLQQYNLKYYKWSFLPNVSAFGNYNLNYINNNFGKLYSRSFPNSNVGVQLAFPIFQGGKRIFQVRAAEWQVKRLDWEMTSLQNIIRTEYAQAMALYKGNLANYEALKENVQLASEVYNVIRLQYQQGIKTYLDVIIAESDLRSSQLNFYAALYQLLQSKIDVQKALGTLSW
ncbi:MAG: TolC family protein [Bacteroidetes bacterium]|nr:MAG: TolC family protein [Bacteroidota bacterium]